MLLIKTVLTMTLLIAAMAQVFLTANGEMGKNTRARLTKFIVFVAVALLVIDMFTGNSLQVVWALLAGAAVLTAITLKAQRDQRLWDAVA